MNRIWRTISPEEQQAILDEARRMRAAGASWMGIAAHFQISKGTIRDRLDPSASRRKDRRLWSPPFEGGPPREDVEARRSEIPNDLRSLTARLAGDPLPGRSALDRRGRPL